MACTVQNLFWSFQRLKESREKSQHKSSQYWGSGGSGCSLDLTLPLVLLLRGIKDTPVNLSVFRRSIQNHLCTVSSSLVTALYYPKLVRSLFEKSILAKMSIFSPLCQFCPDIKSVYTHLSPTLPRSHMTLHSCFARLRDTLKNEMLGVQLVYFLGNYYNKGLLDEVYKESKGLVYFYV